MYRHGHFFLPGGEAKGIGDTGGHRLSVCGIPGAILYIWLEIPS